MAQEPKYCHAIKGPCQWKGRVLECAKHECPKEKEEKEDTGEK